MREILFKAKTLSGEWVEGYFAVIGKRSVIIKATPEKFYSVDGEMKESHGNEIFDIDPETLCQYTGLTDKNGKEIFENDIVQYPGIGAIGKVAWYEGDYIGFAVDDICDGIQQYDKEMFCNAEVIGNIFDNPELLEREEDAE